MRVLVGLLPLLAVLVDVAKFKVVFSIAIFAKLGNTLGSLQEFLLFRQQVLRIRQILHQRNINSLG